MTSPGVPNELRLAPSSRPVETLAKPPKRAHIRIRHPHHQDVRRTAFEPLWPELQKRTKKGTPSVADATTSAAAQAPYAASVTSSQNKPALRGLPCSAHGRPLSAERTPFMAIGYYFMAIGYWELASRHTSEGGTTRS